VPVVTRDDFPRFKAELQHFAVVHGKTLTKDLVTAYWQDLKAMDVDAFMRASQRLRRTSEWFPKPSAFLREGEPLWM
jgi:hypothetical protein